MPSIHKTYEYGNVAIEELFDIDISEKVHNTEEMINEKISITLRDIPRPAGCGIIIISPLKFRMAP